MHYQYECTSDPIEEFININMLICVCNEADQARLREERILDCVLVLGIKDFHL